MSPLALTSIALAASLLVSGSALAQAVALPPGSTDLAASSSQPASPKPVVVAKTKGKSKSKKQNRIPVPPAATIAQSAPEPGVARPLPRIAPYDFTGLYLGAQGGWNGFKSSAHTSGGSYSVVSQAAFPLSLVPDFRRSGFAGGLYGGYNIQVDSYVYGVEATLGASAFDGTWRKRGDLFTVSQDATGSARIRVGYAFDRALVFFGGGVSLAQLRSKVFDVSTPASFSFTDTRPGLLLMLGGEYALTDNLVGRIEYNYVDYGKSSHLWPAWYANTASAVGTTFTSKTVTNAVLAGIAYKF